MDTLFKAGSCAERGTLCQIKNMFQHRNVKMKVMNNFNSITDFIQFTTHSLIVLLAMKLYNMSSISSTPAGSMPSSSLKERKLYLQEMASTIVRQIWHQYSEDDLHKVSEAEPEEADDKESDGQ